MTAESTEAATGEKFVQLDKASFVRKEEVTCLRVPLQRLQGLSKALREYTSQHHDAAAAAALVAATAVVSVAAACVAAAASVAWSLQCLYI